MKEGHAEVTESASEEILSCVPTCSLFSLSCSLGELACATARATAAAPYAQLPMSSSGPLPATGTHHTRNRASNRRKSGDRADRANYSYNNDGEKSHVPSLKNLPPIVHHETFFSNVQNDYNQTGLVPLEGCSASEASQLLSDRWTAAMNMYNDQTIDPSEKPVMYSGSSSSSWGHLKLPHQMNFLEELRRALDAHTEVASPVDTWN